MEYTNFGTAGVKVSRLALGLGLRGQADEAAAQRMIEHAIDQGINVIDCANVYAPLDNQRNAGRAEEILGRAIKGKRHDLFLTTKVAGRIGPGVNDSGLSRYAILREIDRSLQRLDTDHIDLYLLHLYDASTPLEETIGALDDLVRAGKVRYVGCCNFAAWQVCRALWIADKYHATPMMTVQNPYNLLNRRLEEEMFGLVRACGLGVMAYSPLAVGLLSGDYRPGQPPPAASLWAKRLPHYERLMQGPAAQVLATLHRLAAELGKTPGQLAIAWLLSHPEVTLAISGADTFAHLDDVLGGVGWTLEPAVRQQLDEVSAGVTIGTF
jgi:aryl-alcohol dehydrogenase-like predicted oxidoreductase